MELVFKAEESYTIREAMRDLNRIIERLDKDGLEKLALTQRNETRAVLVSTAHYSELQRGLSKTA